MYAFSPVMIEGHHEASVGPICSWMLAEFAEDHPAQRQLLTTVGSQELMASSLLAVSAIAEAEVEGDLPTAASWLSILAGTYGQWERMNPSVRLSQCLAESLATSVRVLADQHSAGALVLPKVQKPSRAASAARDLFIRASVVSGNDPVQSAEALRSHYIDFLAGVGFDHQDLEDDVE